jgi:hypothetical protein
MAGGDDDEPVLDRATFWFGMLRSKKESVSALKEEIVELKKQLGKFAKKKPPAKTAPNYAYQSFCRSIEHAWTEARGREEAIAKFTKKPIELTPRPTTCPTPMTFEHWGKDDPPRTDADRDYDWDQSLPKPAGYDERWRAYEEHLRLSKEEYAAYKARGLWGPQEGTTMKRKRGLGHAQIGQRLSLKQVRKLRARLERVGESDLAAGACRKVSPGVEICRNMRGEYHRTTGRR